MQSRMSQLVLNISFIKGTYMYMCVQSTVVLHIILLHSHIPNLNSIGYRMLHSSEWKEVQYYRDPMFVIEMQMYNVSPWA